MRAIGGGRTRGSTRDKTASCWGYHTKPAKEAALSTLSAIQLTRVRDIRSANPVQWPPPVTAARRPASRRPETVPCDAFCRPCRLQKYATASASPLSSARMRGCRRCDRGDLRFAEEVRRRFCKAFVRYLEVVRINLNSDTVPTPTRGGNAGRTGAHEWIQYNIPHEAKHSN